MLGAFLVKKSWVLNNKSFDYKNGNSYNQNVNFEGKIAGDYLQKTNLFFTYKRGQNEKLS